MTPQQKHAFPLATSSEQKMSLIRYLQELCRNIQPLTNDTQFDCEPHGFILISAVSVFDSNASYIKQSPAQMLN